MWALGDCARGPEHAQRRAVDPPTCQHALRQARRLAKNIAGDASAVRYRMLGQVATLGRYKGIADVLGFRLRGFPGWFVTRSYHLYQLPLTRAVFVSSSTGPSACSRRCGRRTDTSGACHRRLRHENRRATTRFVTSS